MTTQISSTQPPLSAAAASLSRGSSTSTLSDSGTATPARDSESPWPTTPVTPRNTLGKKGRNRLTVGQVFGRLQIVEMLRTRGSKEAPGSLICRCQCQCGGTASIVGPSIASGKTNSCGCIRREVSRASRIAALTTHGMVNTPTWLSWKSMTARCGNPNATDYERYGGRGISVCHEWGSFETFYRDMGNRPPGKSLDRIDTNGNYEPGNCRWATSAQQQQNRRNNKLDWDTVREIRSLCLPSVQISAMFGVSDSMVGLIRRNKVWVDKDYTPDSRWVLTRAEQNHNRRDNKLNWEIVNKIRTDTLPHRTLAAKYGVYYGTIGKVKRNEIWIDNEYLPTFSSKNKRAT